MQTFSKYKFFCLNIDLTIVLLYSWASATQILYSKGDQEEKNKQTKTKISKERNQKWMCTKSKINYSRERWTGGTHPILLPGQEKWCQKVSIGFGPILVIDEFDKFQCNKGEWIGWKRKWREMSFLVLLLIMHLVYITPENVW